MPLPKVVDLLGMGTDERQFLENRNPSVGFCCLPESFSLGHHHQHHLGVGCGGQGLFGPN